MNKKTIEKNTVEKYFDGQRTNSGVVILDNRQTKLILGKIGELEQKAREEGYEECKKDFAVSVGLATDTEFSEIVGKIADKLLKTKEDEK